MVAWTKPLPIPESLAAKLEATHISQAGPSKSKKMKAKTAGNVGMPVQPASAANSMEDLLPTVTSKLSQMESQATAAISRADAAESRANAADSRADAAISRADAAISTVADMRKELAALKAEVGTANSRAIAAEATAALAQARVTELQIQLTTADEQIKNLIKVTKQHGVTLRALHRRSLLDQARYKISIGHPSTSRYALWDAVSAIQDHPLRGTALDMVLKPSSHGNTAAQQLDEAEIGNAVLSSDLTDGGRRDLTKIYKYVFGVEPKLSVAAVAA
ncbi:hypothetical protein H0H81_001194 [Sphagnurus paluster]|uniref:Uncharacterized protein n=1 Tax=Sphagnurus paluster TaxID=117069 RepID=A0A9P7GG62_9AGAR|nr:hypothetical protein H0H81_001194 [Sphagnurus paluster]